MARRISQLVAQRADLVGRVDVAGEKDKAEGPHIAEERHFFARQGQPVRIQDRRPEGTHQRVTTGMQSAFSATSAEQKRRASAMSSNPMARRR